MICVRVQRHVFPLLSARKIALFTGHDLSWMDNIEQNQSDEHRERVQAVLVRLVARNRAFETLGVFGNAEQNSQLNLLLAAFCSPKNPLADGDKHTVIRAKTA